jgi:hypothetical protein
MLLPILSALIIPRQMVVVLNISAFEMYMII